MSSPPSVSGFGEGQVLAGKYRIDKVLGAGGMGVVVAAHHLHLDQRFAIKFLLPEMMGNGEAVARFAREAQAAVRIQSEHVARVSDVGTLESGAPFMVMEYLEGGDLAAWLKQRGALSVEQAVEFVLQACEAIAEAHTLGIVHRDLKPANLFVIRRPDGPLSIKVLDFGISKWRGVGSSLPDVSITRTSAMMGSPLYMSPEQMQSAKDVDARTDIWALGVILYELITAETPFLAESVPELIAKILSMPPPPLRSKCAEAPDGLEAVIARCLEKDRTRRFESVGEFAHALTPFAPRRSRLSLDRIAGVMRAAGLPGGMTALPPSSDPTEPAAVGTQSAWGRTSASGGRAKLTLAAGALVVLAGFALVLLPKSPEPAPTALTSTAAADKPTLSTPPAPVPVPVAPASVVPASVVPASVVPTANPVVAAAAETSPAPVASSPKSSRLKPRAKSAPAANVPRPPAPPPSPTPSPVAPTPAAKAKAGGAFDDRR